MPNHVLTILEIFGPVDQVQKFIEDSSRLEGRFSFEALMPMPEELRGTASPATIMTQEEIDRMDPRDLEFQKPITQEKSDYLISKYGANNWYDWRLKNYGTKWGAYDVGEWGHNLGNAKISYCTAWCPATEFYQQISMRAEYDELLFKHTFADDGGFFIGFEMIKDGCVIDVQEFDWNSEKARELREFLGMIDDSEIEEETMEN